MAGYQIDIIGLLHHVYVERDAGGYRLQEFAVKVPKGKKDGYDNFYLIQLWGDKINLLSDKRLGDAINCHCTLKGREYLGGDEPRYFISLHCFAIGDPLNPKSDKSKKNIEQSSIIDELNQDEIKRFDKKDYPKINSEINEDDDDLPF